jgi:hypothetical protein
MYTTVIVGIFLRASNGFSNVFPMGAPPAVAYFERLSAPLWGGLF